MAFLLWQAITLLLLRRLASGEQDVAPYAPHHHGPIRRGNFNSSFETAQAAAPNSSLDFYNTQRFSINGALGHMTVVYDPVGSLWIFYLIIQLRTVSVYEPSGPGGCGLHQDNRTRVSKTAEYHNCFVAMNGGFFNTSSDGRVIQTTNLENANFGIRADGTLVIGYLTQDEANAKDNPFVQLIAGVVWLVRNGRNNVFDAMNVEFAGTEETGTMNTFGNVVTARSAIGFDANGTVYLVQVDGQSWVRGVSLYTFADLLIQLRIVNAINLDGGGSSVTVSDDEVVSFPSDPCSLQDCPCLGGADSCQSYCDNFHCERKVTTVICVHAPLCNDGLGCGEYGQCANGQCTCHNGWAGDRCETRLCNNGDGCGVNGTCYQGLCRCIPGWEGPDCNTRQCHYGIGCLGQGMCVDGECRCWNGWTGSQCLDVFAPLGPSSGSEVSGTVLATAGFSLVVVCIVALFVHRGKFWGRQRSGHQLLSNDVPMDSLDHETNTSII